ncbi:hypothetical protein TWF730_009983 [Orbilia blumenaviensis]|uniref:Uncharacterized protein n=1 Tax=Orbilia blumenaviensis TaxID=1796055 RepID=A0AAV9UTD0_9PEZI
MDSINSRLPSADISSISRDNPAEVEIAQSSSDAPKSYLVPNQVETFGPLRASSWKIDWFRTLSPLLLLIVSVGGAVGNHFYFAYLNGKIYANVEWTSRYALAIAFLVKTGFAISMSTCFEQVLWLALRTNTKGITVTGIDSLFTSTNRFLSLFSKDAWIGAPFAIILACTIWLLSLIAIVAPTTLTVSSTLMAGSGSCRVPSLNISVGPRVPRHANDLTEYDLKLEYTNPSPTARRIGTITTLTNDITPFASPCGNNCSYDITFLAPAWKCSSIKYDDYAGWSLAGAAPLWWEDSPYASIYNCLVDNRTSTFWLAHIPGYYTVNLDDSSGTRYELDEIEAFYCDDYNASYSVRFSFSNGQFLRPDILDIEFLNKVPVYLDLLNLENYNMLGPYRSVLDHAAHQSIFRTLAAMLVGVITLDPRTNPDYKTLIVQSPAFLQPVPPLRGDAGLLLQNRLQNLVAELSANYTLSLLAYPEVPQYAMVDTTCNTTQFEQIWRYQPQNLVIAYGCGAVVALFAIIVAGIAVAKNGVLSGTGFTQILCTTRSEELDELVKGNCLGAFKVRPKDLEKVRLRFGALRQPHNYEAGGGLDTDSDFGHIAFGTPDTIMAIVKHGKYV